MNFDTIEQERIKNYNLSKPIFIKTNDTDQENKINVFKWILKSSISTKDYEMLKRERTFYDSNKDKRFPKFIHAYQDLLHLYMEISLRIKFISITFKRQFTKN